MLCDLKNKTSYIFEIYYVTYDFLHWGLHILLEKTFFMDAN